MNTEMNTETALVQQKLSSVWPEWKITKKLEKSSAGDLYEITRSDSDGICVRALKVLRLEAPDAAAGPSDTDWTRRRTMQGSLIDEENTYAGSAADSSADRKGDALARGVRRELDRIMQLDGTKNTVQIEDYAILRARDKCTVMLRMENPEPLNSYLWRRGGLLERDELIRLGTDICSALSACERHNILHRDIKTGSIFYSEKDGFKLGDFGISELASLSGANASDGKTGTLLYMAPEVYRGEEYKNTSDIYSLGIVLYILSNGLVPPLYEDKSGSTSSALSADLVHEANMRRLSGEALPYPRNADGRFASAICTACCPDPARRFRTAESFRNALLDCLRDNRDNTGIPADKNAAASAAGSVYSSAGDTSASYKNASDSRGNTINRLIYILVGAAALLLVLVGVSFFTKSGGSSSDSNSASPSGTVQVSNEAASVPADDEGEVSEQTADNETVDTSQSSDNNEDDGTSLVEGSDPYDEIGQTQDSGDYDTESTVGTIEANNGDAVTDTNDPDAVIQWTDDNLKKAALPQIQEQLGISGDITVSDARKVQTLNLTDSGISDISSLSSFIGLNELSLGNNFITDISAVADMKKLEYLNLEENLVSDLTPLTGHTKIRKLDLYENNVSDLTPIAGLTGLTMLDIRNNNVSDISVLQNMNMMKELYLSTNREIKDLSPLSNMPRMYYLSFKETSVTDISPLRDDTSLTTLVMSYTGVRDISVIDRLHLLGYLDIRGCSINDYGPADRVDMRKGAKVER